MNVIQIYAPTNDKLDDKVEEFYAKLEEAPCLMKNG